MYRTAEEGSRRIHDTLAKSNHWASAALLIYLFTMVGTFLVARNILTGTLRLYPRLFFAASLFLQGMSFLAFQYFVVQTPGRMYVKIRWEVQLFTTMGVLFFVWQAAEALCFVFEHGNRMGFQPFEKAGDLGTRYLTSHFAFFWSGLCMTFISASVVASYSLGTDNPALIYFNSAKIIKVARIDLNNS